MKRLVLTLAVLGTAFTLQAKVVLPSLFADHMVLQQQTEARFWGTAAPGKKVTIRPSWGSQTITATADAEGRWQADVPTPQAGGPYSIDLSDGERLTLNDVLIGEVWLCSGQSNMEMPMRGFTNQPVTDPTDIIARAKASTQIRLVHSLPPPDGFGDFLDQLSSCIAKGGGAVKYGGHKSVLFVFKKKFCGLDLYIIIG